MGSLDRNDMRLYKSFRMSMDVCVDICIVKFFDRDLKSFDVCSNSYLFSSISYLDDQ